MQRLLILIFLLYVSIFAIGQDLNFSQFYELPLLRNPALAGIFNGDIRVQSVYRDQWRSVTVPFRTGAVSCELKFPVANTYNHFTASIQTTYDIAGDSKLSRLQILPVLSYHHNLNGEDGAYLSGSFMAGAVSSQYDPSQLKWGDQYVNGQYDPSNPTRQLLNRTGKNFMDLSAGISLTSPFPVAEEASFYIGVGLFHINKPVSGFELNSLSETRLDRKWALNAGMVIPTSESQRINLFSDFFLQGGHRSFMAGAFYTNDLMTYYEDEDKTSISFGASYRWDDAFIPVIRLDHHHFSFGLSYDVNISKLKTASMYRGGFELTLNYRSFLTNRNENAVKMRCPSF